MSSSGLNVLNDLSFHSSLSLFSLASKQRVHSNISLANPKQSQLPAGVTKKQSVPGIAAGFLPPWPEQRQTLWPS